MSRVWAAVPALHRSGVQGWPNTGVFLQITCDDAQDLPVPDQKFTFGGVKAAGARGDFQVLRNADAACCAFISDPMSLPDLPRWRRQSGPPSNRNGNRTREMGTLDSGGRFCSIG